MNQPKRFEATSIEPLKNVICLVNENTNDSLIIRTDAIQAIEIDQENISIITLNTHYAVSLQAIGHEGTGAIGLRNTLMSLLRS